MTTVHAARGLVPSLPARAWLVLGGDAVSAVGSGLTLPFFVVYLSQVRGIDLGLAGLMLSTVAVAGLAGNPAGGWLADRIDARRAVIVGLVLAAAGSLAMALVHEAWQGFAAAALYGVGAGVLLPAQDALLATVVDDGRRPHVFALRHATLNVGFSVGALVAAVVVAGVPGSAGFVVLYLADAVSFLAFAGLLAAVPGLVAALPAPDQVDAGPSGTYRDVVADRVFVRVWLLVLLLVTAGYAQYHAAFPAFATVVGGLSAWGLSIAFAANTLDGRGGAAGGAPPHGWAAADPRAGTLRGARRAAWLISLVAAGPDRPLRRRDGRVRAGGDAALTDGSGDRERPGAGPAARPLQRRLRAGLDRRLHRGTGGGRARARCGTRPRPVRRVRRAARRRSVRGRAAGAAPAGDDEPDRRRERG